MKNFQHSRFASHLIENREIRIFLSSTFSDMDDERSALVKLFQKLKVEANQRNVALTLLDLRWGVTDEESRTGKVLSVCLNEIENSHPFFIGLLGSRYGYSPKASELKKNPELTERYPWIEKDIADRMSITEIEMQYGVLRSHHEMDAAFFIKNTQDTLPDDNVKLTTLKSSIRKQKRFPVGEYDSIDNLCKQVEKVIIALLDKYYKDSDNTRLGRERAIQQAYINSRHRFYVPHQEDFDRLNQFMTSEERHLVVTGKSGMGKSALIANWLKEIERNQALPYNIIYHFVGNSFGGNSFKDVLQHFSDELFFLYEGIEIKMGNYESLEEKNQRYMTEAVQKGDKPLLIVIDGINQIDEQDQAKLLNWLPQSTQKVKYLFSTLEDDETMKTFIRRNYPQYKVTQLRKRDKFIKDYLSLVGKKLDEKQINSILKTKVTGNTLVLKTLLDELICFGSYEHLNKRIDYYLAATSIPDFFYRMLQRLENDYKDARHLLSLIAVSEHGLSEDEIISITGIRQVDFHYFYCAISSHLINSRGMLVFVHQYIKDAIWTYYNLQDKNSSKHYRKEIINYFSKEEIPNHNRQISELAFQYYNIDDNESLYNTILSFEAFEYFNATTMGKALLASYWRKLRLVNQEEYKLRNYLDLPFDGIPISSLPYLEIESFLLHYLADYDASLLYAKTYLMMLQSSGDFYSLNLSTCYNNIGVIYQEKGNHEQALPFLEKALQIRENLLGIESVAVATSYNNIGMVYEAEGEYDNAIEYFLKAHNVCVKIYGTEHPKTAITIDNIGLAYDGKEDYEKALKYHFDAMGIFEKLFGTYHLDTADSYYNIGSTYTDKGEYDLALRYHKRALEIRLNLLGIEHPKSSYSFFNVGKVFFFQEDYKQAIFDFLKAAKIQKSTLGLNNHRIATTFFYIGRCYDLMEEYEYARDYYHKALVVQEEQLGEDINTATTYYNLACVYWYMGTYDLALDYHMKALKIREKKLNNSDPDLGRSYNNIGNIYSQRGDFDEALSYYMKAIIILEQKLSPTHIDTIMTYYNIGNAYLHKIEINDAVKWFRKAAEQGDEGSLNTLKLLEG